VEILRALRDRSGWPWGHRGALERGIRAQLAGAWRAAEWTQYALDTGWSVTPGPDLPLDRELSPLEWAVRDTPWPGVEYGYPAEREELARWLDAERKELARRLVEEDLCPVCGAPPSGPDGCIECRLAGRVKPYPAHWIEGHAERYERADGTVHYAPRGAEEPPRVDWRALIRELRDRAVRL
jgi:hypothetical protein